MKVIKVDEETYNLLKQISEKTGRSIKEIATISIRVYWAGQQIIDVADKEIEKIEGKWITLKYPTRCSICKRQLEQGKIAYYEKYYYSDHTKKARIICEKCYYSERVTDKALIKVYLKKRELQKIVNALKNEADRLADKVIELQKKANIYELKHKIAELVKESYEALDYLTNPEIEDRLKKFIEFLTRLESAVEKIEEYLDEDQAVKQYKRIPMRKRSKQWV